MSDYWSTILNKRVGRRRALTATGGAAAAAAFLAACGGSDNSGDGSSNTSGLISQPVDTTKDAKRGGTLKWFAGNEPAHLDVQIDQAPANQHKNMVYGHLVNDKAGYLKGPDYNEVVPEMAESWEWSPDRLQLTMKIRQGVKFHNKSPVNGRLMDVDDVVFSWDRLAAKGTDRRFLANVANPNAPVLSFTAVDPRTIVIKLKDPVVYLLPALTPRQTGRPSIIPKETDGSFDIRSDMIGTGPFVMEKWTPSVGFSYTRNQDYYDKDIPLLDRVEMPTVLEYAAALSQLKAGNMYTYASTTSAVRGADVLPLKRDVPQLQIYESPPTDMSIRSLAFGILPAGRNPLADERVRQAISMSWDRDAWIDTFFNVANFESEGLPVKSYWSTALFPGAGAWWLDPQGKDFGPNAKYFAFDLAESKKLLAAAGYASGLEVTSNYIGGTQLGADFQRQAQVRDEFAAQAGFRVKTNVIDYTTYYIPTIRDGGGKYEGWGYRAGGTSAMDAVATLLVKYQSKYGQGFLGFDAKGTGDASGDPALDDMILRARSELDTEKRRTLVFDIQRHLAKTMYDIPDPGGATQFLMAWPALKNFQVFQGDRRGGNATSGVHSWWIDETQAPIARA